MAGPYHGKSGNIDYGVAAGAPLQNIQTWSLTTVADTAESSSMGDEWQDFNSGLTDFNATAECLSQVALDTIALLGSSETDVQFSFVAGGPEFTGGAIISGITETASVDGNITISYTIEGNDTAGLVYNATGGVAASGNSDTIHGKQLHASAGGAITNPTEWSISLTAALADSTAAHASNTGRTKLAGLKGATATITAKADAGVEVVDGASVAMILGRSSTVGDGQYTGTAICTGSEFGVDVNDVDVITYNFIFTTAVVLAVA